MTTMIQFVLRVAVVLVFFISVIWLIYEPNFDSLLALLGSLITLLTLPHGQDKTASQVADEPSNQTYTKAATIELPRMQAATVQAFSNGLTNREQLIVNKLHAAFRPLRNLLPTVCLISLIFSIIAFALMAFEADEITLIFTGLFWLFAILNVYVTHVNHLHRRISVTGFYDIKTVSKREAIKAALYQQAWGSAIWSWYMPILVHLLLIPNKTEANKILRGMKS